MAITELESEFLAEQNKKQTFKTEKKHIHRKATEDLGDIITPIYDEIPPDPKTIKFLTEGMRSWAFIAISAIADEISTTELSLFRRVKQDWLEIENHQVLNVIAKPNDIQTKEELLWLASVYLLAAGEAPLLLDNSSNPTQFVLLNPERLKIKFDKDNLISKYIYTQSNGQMKDIDKDLVVFMKLPSIHSPFRGTGIMKYVAQTLDIDNYIEEYLRRFFFNDATPGSVLETEKELSDESYKRLQSIIKIRHQGVKKAHKNLILEGGLKWKDVGMKLSELQIKETSDSIRDKVLAAFKVPKSILGITEDVNRANGENSDRVFAKRCIKPKLRLIQAQLNMFFIPKFSDKKEIWLEFENPVKEDELIQAQVDQIYVMAGIWTKNEVRARMEMLPLEEVAVDNTPQEDQNPTDEAGKGFSYTGRKHPNPFRINRIKGIYEAVEEKEKQSEKKDAFVEVMKDFIKTKEVKKEFTSEEKIDLHTKKVEVTDVIENGYKKILVEYFKNQGDKIIEQVKSYKRKDVNINYDEDKQAKLMAEISIPFIEEAVVKESELAYAFVGLSDQRIDPQDDLVRSFIKKRTLKLGKTTTETTRLEIQSILQDWAEEEGDIESLRGMLREYFGSGMTDRIDMIARTEVSRAAGFAQETVYEQVGAEGKQWLTAQDEKVCEFCSEMDGKTIGITDSFWGKGEQMVGAEGGSIDFSYETIETPPLHPSCRCDMIPIFSEAKNMHMFKKKNAKEIAKLKALKEKEALLEKRELRLVEKEQKNK